MASPSDAERGNEYARLLATGLPDAEARRMTAFPPAAPRAADFEIGLTDQQLLVRRYMREDGMSEVAALRLATSAEQTPGSHAQIIAAEKINVVAGLAFAKEQADRNDPAFIEAFDRAQADARQRLANQAEQARASEKLSGLSGIEELSDLDVIEAAGYTPVQIPQLAPLDHTRDPEWQANAAAIKKLDPTFFGEESS